MDEKNKDVKPQEAQKTEQKPQAAAPKPKAKAPEDQPAEAESNQAQPADKAAESKVEPQPQAQSKEADTQPKRPRMLGLIQRIVPTTPSGETDTKPTQAPVPTQDLTKKTLVDTQVDPKSITGANPKMPSSIEKK